MRENKFGASGNNISKHVLYCEARMKIWVQNFWACTLKIFGRPTRRDFGQLLTLIA